MRMFKDMGMTEVVLGVHTTNPTGAFQLYEGLGYLATETGYELRKPLSE
jgi:ribosomal protein S18 acetylase RimI-like enzyme